MTLSFAAVYTGADCGTLVSQCYLWGFVQWHPLRSGWQKARHHPWCQSGGCWWTVAHRSNELVVCIFHYIVSLLFLSLLLLYHEQDGTVEQKYRWFWIGVSIFLLNAEVVQFPLYINFVVRILYQAVPLYVAEISPENLRGRMQSLPTVYGTVGVLVRSNSLLHIIARLSLACYILHRWGMC